jgi:hypothetical protein
LQLFTVIEKSLLYYYALKYLSNNVKCVRTVILDLVNLTLRVSEREFAQALANLSRGRVRRGWVGLENSNSAYVEEKI